MVERPPAEIGKYRIEGELGRGGMGVVYRAFDRVVERPVAIKTIGFGEARCAKLLDQLKREAKAVGLLEHPNIVSLYDAGESEGLYYLVMPLVQGETLHQRIGRLPEFSLQEILEIFRQLLGALAYAHSRGVIHRDIKPANIMITPEGVVKLTDFGVAKLADAGISTAGMVVGTPSYMSPEQILGRPVDARSDIFATGCMLYELVTGDKAFGGGNTTAIIYRIIHDAPVLPSALMPEIEPGLQAVILRALAKDPAERFGSCAAFQHALQCCMAGMQATFSMEPRSRAAGRSGNAAQRRTAVQALRNWNRPAVWLALIAGTLCALLSPALVLRSTPGKVRIREPQASVASRAVAKPVPAAPLEDAEAPVDEAVAAPLVPQPAPAPRRRRAERPSGPVPAVAPDAIPEPPRRDSLAPPERRLLLAEPETFGSFMLRGDQAYQQGRYAEALGRYSEALRIKPADSSVRRKLSVVLTLLGRTEAAREYRK